MFERQRNIEQGKSEPEWLRRAADQLGEQERIEDEAVVESIGNSVQGLDTFSTLLGQTAAGETCTIDGDCAPADGDD